MATLLGPAALHHMTAAQAELHHRSVVLPPPHLAPFGKGLTKAFDFAAIVCVLGAVARCCGGASTTTRTDEGATWRWACPPTWCRPKEAVAETEPLLVD